MTIRSKLVVAIIAALPAIAMAQTATDAREARIDQRQANQQERIDQGVQSGQLNQRETARLEKGQARVQGMEDRAAADGKVTRQEARHIERAQDRQSARIYRQKHDKQTAYK
ncbi:MAG: hypothetical protein ABL891_21470 [Burkholderiales bacterium]